MGAVLLIGLIKGVFCHVTVSRVSAPSLSSKISAERLGPRYHSEAVEQGLGCFFIGTGNA